MTVKTAKDHQFEALSQFTLAIMINYWRCISRMFDIYYTDFAFRKSSHMTWSVTRNKGVFWRKTESTIESRLRDNVEQLWKYPFLHNLNCIIIAVQTGARSKSRNALGYFDFDFFFSFVNLFTHNFVVVVIVLCFVWWFYQVFWSIFEEMSVQFQYLIEKISNFLRHSVVLWFELWTASINPNMATQNESISILVDKVQ